MDPDKMSSIQLVVLVIGLAGFAIAFVVQFILKKHVSMEKIKAETDPSKIFQNSIPPKKYLTDQGIKLFNMFKGGAIVFIGAIVVLMLTNFDN